MQGKKCTPLHFLHRTDNLAARLGVNIQDLPDIIGISRRTLFGSRSEKGEVSTKTFAKLEAAEREAGLLSLSHVVDAEARQTTGEAVTSEENRLIVQTKHTLDPIIREIVAGLLKLPTLSEIERLAKTAKRWPLSDEDKLKPLHVLIKELKK